MCMYEECATCGERGYMCKHTDLHSNLGDYFFSPENRRVPWAGYSRLVATARAHGFLHPYLSGRQGIPVINLPAARAMITWDPFTQEWHLNKPLQIQQHEC